MQEKSLRVVHYLNQFFGGMGGENQAEMEPQIKEGPVGPAKALQQALGKMGEVVATVICGDNYFAERIEGATAQVIQIIESRQPTAVIAGPAFNAGRYGIACGAVCKAAQEQLNIPAVTGMYKENPGVDLYRKNVYIIETGASAGTIAQDISKMLNILLRLFDREKIGKPSEEGYFPRGFLANQAVPLPAAERAVSMLLDKIKGKPFKTEVPLPRYDQVAPAPGIRDLSSATIALVTDGGLVPKGNPDKIELLRATRFGRYSIMGVETLGPKDYDVTHSGYNNMYVLQDPNRMVPVDVFRDLEKEGVIGKLNDFFYSTCGCASVVDLVTKFGREMATKLKQDRAHGAILTST